MKKRSNGVSKMIKSVTESQVESMVKFYGTIEAARKEWKRLAAINAGAILIADSGKIISTVSRCFKECYSFRIGPDYTAASYTSGNHHATLSEWVGRSFEDFDRGMQNRGFHHAVEVFEACGRKLVDHYYVK